MPKTTIYSGSGWLNDSNYTGRFKNDKNVPFYSIYRCDKKMIGVERFEWTPFFAPDPDCYF